MKDNLIKARTCVYNVNYHVVCSVKYRKKVLNKEVESRLKELCLEIADEKDFQVHLVEVGEQDHVHLFISGHPKHSPSYMVKMRLKG